MSIYTRTGDTGTTALFGGKRVLKCEELVDVYGSIDELNSWVGLIASDFDVPDVQKFLESIQSDLFTIGSFLSGNKKIDLGSIGKRVGEMEKLIDAFDKSLPVLKNFILPGGSHEASFSHLARSICRRAEREVIRLPPDQPRLNRGQIGVDNKVIVYLNRLSDLLFVVGRHLNSGVGVFDTVWNSKK